MTYQARSVMRLLAIGVICAAVGVDGWAFAQAPPAPPQRMSRDWKRLALGDLTAAGNASENDLRRALTALDDFRHALRYFFKWANGTADLHTYLRALQGGPIEDGVRAACGMSLPDLQSELSNYVRRFQFSGVLLPPRPAATAARTEAARMSEADAAYLRGDLLVRLGDEDAAERELERVLAIDPVHVPARIAMARVRMLQERGDEAIEMLEAAAEADPSSFAPYYFLGAVRHREDRHEEAIAAYEAALKIRPRSARTWFGLSTAALGLGREKHADRALQQVLALDSSPRWYRLRAYDAYEDGYFEAIGRDVRSYVAERGWGDESGPYLAFLAALAAWKLDRPAEAEAILAEAAPAVVENSWRHRILQFLRGELTGDALVSRARNNDERTEAHAYVGIKAAIDGRVDEARRHLQWVKDRGTRSYVEYGMALADLERLDTVE